MAQWFQTIKHHKDKVTGAGHGNHLSTTTLAVLGAFNDTRQIQQLDLGALVLDASGNSCERCELVGCYFRVDAS